MAVRRYLFQQIGRKHFAFEKPIRISKSPGSDKKRRPKAPFSNYPSPATLRRFGFFLLLHRAGVLALGIDVAIDELDHGHRGIVAVAEAGLDDAGVAALAVLVAGRQHIEQLLDLVDVAHLRDGLTAQGKAALLAERDQLLDDRT